MSVGILRVTQSTLNLTPAIFIDDLLDYVYQRLEVHRLPIMRGERRGELISSAAYTFSSEIGDALIHILKSFNNIAESLIVLSNLLRAEEARDARSARVINLLKFHEVSSLTDADFDHDPSVWSSQLLHYLVIATSLCLYFDKSLDILSSINVIVETSEVLNSMMAQRTSEKIESFKQYARSTLNEPPLTHTTVYELY